MNNKRKNKKALITILTILALCVLAAIVILLLKMPSRLSGSQQGSDVRNSSVAASSGENSDDTQTGANGSDGTVRSSESSAGSNSQTVSENASEQSTESDSDPNASWVLSVTETPTPEPTPDPDSPEGRAATLGLPTPPDIDITSWEYVLANADHPLPGDFAPEEIAYVGEQKCAQDARIAEALTAFANGCKAAGLPVYLSSGYRSYALQEELFNHKLSEFDGNYESAARIVLPPGTSEHQTGLCCDITDEYRSPKYPEVLSKTESFQWMNEHCAEYGFILRYPEDKEEITGIIYEPWHFRYVGVDVAQYIKENNLCLEEFLALYSDDIL